MAIARDESSVKWSGKDEGSEISSLLERFLCITGAKTRTSGLAAALVKAEAGMDTWPLGWVGSWQRLGVLEDEAEISKKSLCT